MPEAIANSADTECENEYAGVRTQDEWQRLAPGHELLDPLIQALARFRMATSPRDLPTPEAERDLHCRLMELDPVAPAELADAYISHLVDWLRRRNSSTIDDHMLMEAAGDAILSFAKKPDTYRADCGKSLIGYLQMSALGDLKNLLKKRSRQVGRSVDWDSVELSPDAGNALWHVDDPLDAIISVEAAAQVRRELLPVIQAGLSAEERDCLDLYLDGERQTDPYTTALRISGLPEDEQRRRVKQVKDMLKKRIERGRSRHDK